MLLGEYWRVIRRRWRVVAALIVAFAAAGALWSSTQGELYSSTATVITSNPESQAILDNVLQERSPSSDRDTASLVQVVRSDEVLSRAVNALSDDTAKAAAKGVVATPVLGANAITLTSVATDPEAAADAANAVAAALVKQLNDGHERNLQRTEESLAEQVAQAAASVRVIAEEIDVAAPGPGVSLQLLELNRETAEFDALNAQLALVRVQQSVDQEQVRVSTQAVPGAAATGPKPLQSGILAGTIGLVLGIVLAFGIESTDDAVAAPVQASELLGAPLLGQVRLRVGGDARQQLQENPAADQFWSAAMALASTGDRAVAVAITTADSRTQHGPLAIALAESFARAGRKTLLVCADTGSGSAAGILSLSGVGFAEVLSGNARAADAAVCSEEPGLDILAPGSAEQRDFLPSDALDTAIRAFRAEYGAVVFDSPALGAYAGAIAMACDGAIVPVTIRATTRSELERSKEFLSRIGAPVLGVLTVETRT